MKPTYLIIGLTQQGKSSICKSIFKDEDILIGIGDSGNSVTTQPRAYQQIGIKIQLVDTVGLQDTNEFNAQTEGIITKSLNYCQKQKILSLRGIIITISFRQQEIKQISALLLNLQRLFKLKNFDSLIFCLTKGNELNNQIRVHQIEFLKQVLANEFSISYERIIQFNTNYIEPSGKYIEFKNEKKRFLENLQNLSNSMIKIEMNQQIIELQVKPLHAGGRHKILRSSGYFTFEDSMMLSKLYQISNLKICQESKGYQKTSEDIKKDNKMIFLKSSNLFKNNILFRHAILRQNFLIFSQLESLVVCQLINLEEKQCSLNLEMEQKANFDYKIVAQFNVYFFKIYSIMITWMIYNYWRKNSNHLNKNVMCKRKLNFTMSGLLGKLVEKNFTRKLDLSNWGLNKLRNKQLIEIREKNGNGNKVNQENTENQENKENQNISKTQHKIVTYSKIINQEMIKLQNLDYQSSMKLLVNISKMDNKMEIQINHFSKAGQKMNHEIELNDFITKNT